MAAPIENSNAETWDIEASKELFIKAKKLAKEIDTYNTSNGLVDGYKFHYIGEIASELETHRDIFKYLKSKYEELKPLYETLKTRLESNCFSDSKKGIIKEATAIMNLKSNYGWTDRTQTDLTTLGKEIKQTPTVISFFKTDDE